MAEQSEVATKKKGGGCLVVFGGLVIAIVIFVIVTSNSQSKTTSNAGSFESGDSAIINMNTYIGLGELKSNMNELTKYAVANNVDAINGMVGEGKIIYELNGTKINVIDKGFALTEIQVVSTGERGWVPNEYISKQ